MELKKMLVMLMCLVVSGLGFAQENDKKIEQTRNPNAVVTSDAEMYNSARLAVGPSLLLLNGESMFGANVDATFRVAQDLPLYVGVDFGFHRTSVASIGVNSIHVLATTHYKLGPYGPAEPFIGLSVGPNFASASGLSSATNIQLMVRPGADIVLSESVSLGIEARVGIIESSFAFNPLTNLVVGF